MGSGQAELSGLPPRLDQGIHRGEPGASLVRDRPDRDHVPDLLGRRDESGLQREHFRRPHEVKATPRPTRPGVLR